MFFFLYVRRTLLSLNGRDVGPVRSSLRTVTAGGFSSSVFLSVGLSAFLAHAMWAPASMGDVNVFLMRPSEQHCSDLRNPTRVLEQANCQVTKSGDTDGPVVDSIRLHFIMVSFDVLSYHCRVARGLSIGFRLVRTQHPPSPVSSLAHPPTHSSVVRTYHVGLGSTSRVSVHLCSRVSNCSST